MRLSWNSGVVQQSRIDHRVDSPVVVIPSIIVVPVGAIEHRARLVIRTPARPTRILAVQGTLLASPVALSGQASLTQDIEVLIDIGGRVGDVSSVIEVLTDHPQGQSLKIKVLIPRQTRGADHDCQS